MIRNVIKNMIMKECFENLEANNDLMNNTKVLTKTLKFGR